MAEVNTKVTSIVGRTEVTFKDSRTGADITLPKYVVQTDDGKIYEWMTKSTVEVGTEMKGTAETDTRSGMLRFKPTKTGGGWSGGRGGGGESTRQTALKAAAAIAKNAEEAIKTAEEFLKWLDQESKTTVDDVKSVFPGATEEPPADEIAKSDARAAAEEMDL